MKIGFCKISFFILLAAILGLASFYFSQLVALAAAFLCLLVFFWRYTEFSFFALVAYLPFQIALNLAPDMDLLSGRILILGLFFVWFLKIVVKKDWSRFAVFKTKFAFALILFLVVSLLSLISAQNYIWGLRKFLVFLSIFPLYFLTMDIVSGKEKQKKLIFVILGAAGFSALIALAQFFSQFIFSQEAVFSFFVKNIEPIFLGNSFAKIVAQNPSWLIESAGAPLMRAVGLFPDPHMLSFFLGIVAPLCLVWLFFEKRKKALVFFIFILLLTAIGLTFSRGGYLGVIFSLCLTALLFWPHLEKKAKSFIFSFFALALAVLSWVGFPVIGRFLSSFDLSEGSNFGRLAIWADSFRFFLKNPISGLGLGNYPFAVDPMGAYRSAITSHNLYLDILAETGVFGLLAWLYLFFCSFKQAFLTIKNDFSPRSCGAAGVAGSLAYFCVHSFFETAIFNPTVLAFLIIVLALANMPIQPLKIKNADNY